jgi:hypothetical protein
VQYLTIWDLVLTPFYLVILSALAIRYRNKKYPKGHPLRRYYMPGLYVKFAGVIFIALIYAYYYAGGDTYFYLKQSQIINSSLNESVSTWWQLITNASPENNPHLYKYVSQMDQHNVASSNTVAVIGAIFGLLNGTSYIPVALLFAFFCYKGVWAMYHTFVNIYPTLHKELAIAFLFIPSTFVWGSAIFKDTISLFALGWITYTTFRIFVNRDFSFKNLFMLALSFYLIAVIKVYILLAFIPALSLWLMMNYSYKIKPAVNRWTLNLFFIGITIGGFLFFANLFAKELDRYSLDNIARTSQLTRGYIYYVSEQSEGSAYNLGDFNPTMLGMLSKFPAAVAVTFYRPALWEVKKPIMMLSALEAIAFLILSIMVLATGLKNLKKIFSDPNLLFFLIFSLILAFAVGISTYNFGTLSRYKIPCMPFFAAFLLILYKQKKVSVRYTMKKIERPAPYLKLDYSK